MTLKDKIRDTIRLSIASQLFLLKHKEVGDALKDIDNLTSQLLSAIKKSLPKEKELEDISIIEEIRGYGSNDGAIGYNQAIKDMKARLK